MTHLRASLLSDPTGAAAPTSTSPLPASLAIAGPTFTRLVRVELRKSVDTRAGRALLGVSGLLVLGALAISAVTSPAVGVELHTLITTALIPVAIFLPVIGLLLMSGEFSSRSLVVTLALVASRGRVAAAKGVAAVVVAVAVTVLTGVLAALAAGGLSLAGESVQWSFEWSVLGQLLVLQVINVLVGVGFGLLLQSTLLGVVAYLTLPVLFGAVVLMVPSLRDLAPWIELSTGTGSLGAGSGLDVEKWLQVASVTALWVGGPSALGWLRLRHSDIG
jgi:hypothetical protein